MSSQPSMSASSSASPQPLAGLQQLRALTSSLSKSQMNRMIMEYLIKQGYSQAALDFAREAGLPLNADVNTIEQRKKIRNAIYAGRLQEAIEEINEIDATILELDQDLHFQLLNLQLIETIKEENAKPTPDIQRCVTFAQINLAPRAPTHATWKRQLEKTMALLFFPTDKLVPEMQAVISPDLRVKVAKTANEAILHATGETTESGLIELLQSRVHAEEEAKKLGRWPDNGMDIGLDKNIGARANATVSSAPEQIMQDI